MRAPGRFKDWIQMHFPKDLSPPKDRGYIAPGPTVQYNSEALRFRTDENTVTSPPGFVSEGRLDSIITSTMNLDKLKTIADDELKYYIAMISDEEVFLSELICSPHQFPPGFRRGTSRGMAQHLDDLIKWGVVEPTEHVKTITNYFTVEKKNGSLRLVVDGRKVNRMMKRIPKMLLPKITEVIEYLLNNNYFTTVDGKSYFYQIPIAECIGRFFCSNIAARRGRFTTVRMTRLPMGWNWAPAIAQKISNTLLLGKTGKILGLAWIDNFIFAGKTEHEVEENFKEFIANCRLVGAVVDDENPKIVQRGEVLGLDIDLKQKRYRMSPHFVEKLALKTVGKTMTPRELYLLTGSCVWSGYARHVPLCRFGTAVDVVRRVASFVQGRKLSVWDQPIKFDDHEIAALTHWKLHTLSNTWTTQETIGEPRITVWSDASTTAWAFLSPEENSHEQGIFPHDGWHIFVKEAYAANKGVLAHFGIPRLLCIDNMPLVLAIQRKVSSNKIVNSWMSDWDWENISVKWVPTSKQLADPYTRGLTFPAAAPEGPTTLF